MQECKFQQKKQGSVSIAAIRVNWPPSAAAAGTQLLLRGRVVTISEKWDK